MMPCYRKGGCGPYENRSCSECPASKPEYALDRYTFATKLGPDVVIDASVSECRKMTVWDNFRNKTDEEAAETLAKVLMAAQRLVRRNRLFKSEEWLKEQLLEKFREEVD